jgi:hypothetical protein
MFKLLIALIGVSVAYYAYSAHSFSEGSVRSWLVDHESREMGGKDSACDDYADDVEVRLNADSAKGTWEVEGGKDEICGYIKQASAAYTVLQAQVHTSFDDVTIERGGFPWRSAVVKYTQAAEVNAARVSLASTSHNEVTLKRTFGGFKITRLESTGRTVRQ